MSTFTTGGKTFRFRDKSVPEDRNHCYRPDCQDIGKDLVDFVARWEDVGAGDVGKSQSDAILYTCAEHQGPDFEEAKRLFGVTQKTTSAAYLTADDIRRLRERAS